MTSPVAFVDTNFFARFLLDDHDVQSPLTREAMQAIESGRSIAETSATVIFELVYVLNKIYGLERVAVCDLLADLLSLSGLVLPQKPLILKALGLWRDISAISFADAFHLVIAASSSHQRIATFDRAMNNRIPGLMRIEQFP